MTDRRTDMLSMTHYGQEYIRETRTDIDRQVAAY
jgi:hypothetical protein